MRHIPNVLTVLRVLATPVILQRIWERDLDIALILFFLSGMTDTIDGTLARRFGWSSSFGRLIDPIADKTLLIGTFLTLGMRNYVPFWLVFLVLLRDVLLLAGGLILKSTGRVTEFPPSVFGKLSTLVQLLTCGAILLRWPRDPAPFFYATAALVFLSAFDYAFKIRQKLN